MTAPERRGLSGVYVQKKKKNDAVDVENGAMLDVNNTKLIRKVQSPQKCIPNS